jgi:hypothetical protein
VDQIIFLENVIPPGILVEFARRPFDHLRINSAKGATLR